MCCQIATNNRMQRSGGRVGFKINASCAGPRCVAFVLNMRDFDIQFGPPSHGWMSVQVVADGQQWHCDVSDVPCDSLRGLISSLSMLMQGMRECAVDWSLEPEYAQWTFRRNEDTLEFTITESLSRNRKLAYRGNLPSIIHRITKRLCDLAAEKCWSSPERCTKIGPGRFLQRNWFGSKPCKRTRSNKRTNQAMHASRRSTANLNHSMFAATA